jgi:hypothetical protein
LSLVELCEEKFRLRRWGAVDVWVIVMVAMVD